jgi:hypothetical protein
MRGTRFDVMLTTSEMFFSKDRAQIKLLNQPGTWCDNNRARMKDMLPYQNSTFKQQPHGNTQQANSNQRRMVKPYNS